MGPKTGYGSPRDEILATPLTADTYERVRTLGLVDPKGLLYSKDYNNYVFTSVKQKSWCGFLTTLGILAGQGLV